MKSGEFMRYISQIFLLIALLQSTANIALAEPVQHEVDHFDVLTVNPNLQLNEVLEKTFLRHPLQATLRSRDSVVSAKKLVANAMLPTAPAVSLLHQNDVLGSGRGEREWQAEMELPIWLPNQRNNRLKVADASQSGVIASRESLKLHVAGQLREALWDVAANDNNLALALNQLEVANKLQRDVEKRHQAGEMAKTDVMLAQQETLRAEKDKLRAEAEVMHARHRYYLLTGIRELPVSYTEKQSELEDYSQSSIWLEAQSKVGLAETERSLAQVESHENMQVLFNMRSTKGAFDSTANDSVGLKLRIPFGGETRAAPIKAAAELGVGNALSERETLKYALEAAMHEAEHNLSVSREELAIANKQFDIAKESVRLAQKAFQLGEADLVSLLRVQAQTFEAERAFTTRQIQVQWDIARYNQTVGVLP
ncbi:MAG: TolC family protein [Methylotenera sp.]|nr:TolC family protein [Methylotenera sp.]